MVHRDVDGRPLPDGSGPITGGLSLCEHSDRPGLAPHSRGLVLGEGSPTQRGRSCGADGGRGLKNGRATRAIDCHGGGDATDDDDGVGEPSGSHRDG